MRKHLHESAADRSPSLARSSEADALRHNLRADLLQGTLVSDGLLLDRATAGAPSRAQRILFQLQRQYGNRYVQRALAFARQGGGDAEVGPEIESVIERARGSGQCLETDVRVQMESAFSADFSGVRVHTDSKADALNEAVNGIAFTTGNDIFFRHGAYNPGTPAGKELLAHELTHAIQQGGSPAVQGTLTLGEPDDSYEQEADSVARQVVVALDGPHTWQSQSSSDVGAGAVQRQCPCGGHSASGGECQECRQKREATVGRHGIREAQRHLQRQDNVGGRQGRFRSDVGSASVQRQCACGSQGGQDECEECAQRRQAIGGSKEASGVKSVVRGSGDLVHPFTQTLIEAWFGPFIDQAVVHTDDGGTRNATLNFGARPRVQGALGGSNDGEQKDSQELSSAEPHFKLNADVRIDRPTHYGLASLLSQDGEDSGDGLLGQVGDGAGQQTDGGDGGDGALVAQVGACTFEITYANMQTSACSGRSCGAGIVYDVVGACGRGSGCPSVEGLMVTETATNDHGCVPDNVQTGAGCTIHWHPPLLTSCGDISNCRDKYRMCFPPAAFPAGGCTETVTQQLFVGGALAETHTIRFTITRSDGSCSGTVTRS